MFTIITDLSGVLIQGGFEGAKIAEQRLGIPASKFICRYIAMRHDYDRLLRGEICERQFWETFISKGNWPCSIAQLVDCIHASISQKIPGTLELYQSIDFCPDHVDCPHVVSQRHPQFILASDHDKEQIPFLLATHPEIFQLFQDTYWSCYLGARKKDSPLFLSHILNDHKLHLNQTLFVDDNPKNIHMARSLGIPSIRFKSARDLKHKLSKLGFEFHSDLHI